MTYQDSEKENLNGIQIILEEDMMSAYVMFNMAQSELDAYPKEKLVGDVLNELKRNRIIFGIKREFLLVSFKVYKQYLIAEGIEPIDGEDSVITMYDLNIAKPTLKESEKADFYDVQLIKRIKAGDWLGDRISASDGFPGKSVKGETILQKKGINYPLYYDKKSVIDITFSNKTTLYAKNDGVVNYDDKTIFVSNHLEIAGDVGYRTGNIEFDGFVTIKGTVCDGFIVSATKDIEILGDMGLGNVKKIQSSGGSIFIKGGIASKDSSEVCAKINVYVRFVENTKVTCGGIMNIGFYSVNSNISAKQVLVESTKGKIIGGIVKAEMKISSPFIGSESEKKTLIEVTGFDRNQINEKKTEIDLKIVKLKLHKKSLEDAVGYKTEILLGGNSGEIISRLFTIKEELAALEKEKNELSSALTVKGSGEVQVLKKIFPKVRIIIDGKFLFFTSADIAGSYFVQNDEISKM